MRYQVIGAVLMVAIMTPFNLWTLAVAALVAALLEPMVT